MSWKDYLFFQRKDRIAITTLLILIVISCIIYVMTLASKEPNRQDTFAMEFADFRSKIKEQDTIAFSDNNIYKEQNKNKQYKDSYPVKLSQGETIELNEADTTLLKKIPGIGSGYANRIIAYRNVLGGYNDIIQLKEVWGMDDDLYNKITPYITLKSKTLLIEVNRASFDELNKHPYISYKQAKIITEIRERKGNIESISRLSLLEEFTPNDIKRLKPYLSFK